MRPCSSTWRLAWAHCAGRAGQLGDAAADGVAGGLEARRHEQDDGRHRLLNIDRTDSALCQLADDVVTRDGAPGSLQQVSEVAAGGVGGGVGPGSQGGGNDGLVRRRDGFDPSDAFVLVLVGNAKELTSDQHRELGRQALIQVHLVLAGELVHRLRNKAATVSP